MKNPLSEIYSNQILLNEEKSKSPVVTTKGDIGKVTLVKGQGAEKKKQVETPKEDKKFSQGKEAKTMKESTKSYEGAFEKLFKATINEEEESNEMNFDAEVPTDSEGMMSELEQDDEGSDLMSDLRSVIDNLQNILDKLSEEEGSEEEVEESSEEEGSEEENPYEESVSMKDQGHALGMKAGTDLMSKGKYHVSSKIKSSKGAVHKGELSDSPEPKELGDKKGPLMKKGIQANSSVKTGDFFK
jgi:hypothetical protein